MNFKTKIVMALFAGALAAGIAACPSSAVYAKDKATDTKVVAPTEGYWQKSASYDYKILCPKEPIGVIPAKLFFDDNSKKGDVIITVMIKFPDKLSKQEQLLYERLKEESASDIRKEMKNASN